MHVLSESRGVSCLLPIILVLLLTLPFQTWAEETQDTEETQDKDTQTYPIKNEDTPEPEPSLYTVDLREPPKEDKNFRERFQILPFVQSFLGISRFEVISGLGRDMTEFDNVLWKINVIGNLENNWALRFTSNIDLGSAPVEALPDDLRLTSYRIGLSKTYPIHKDYRLGAYFEAGSATVNFFSEPEPDSPEVAGGLFVDRYINEQIFVRFEYERAWSVAPFVDEYVRNILSLSAGWRF